MRDQNPDRETYGQRSWSGSVTTDTTNGASHTYWLGSAMENGLMLIDIVAFVDAALALNATDYYTFAPVISEANGAVYAVRFAGTGRGNQSRSIPANTPYRIHTEAILNRAIPKDGAVGVRVVTTAPTSVTAQRVSFLARLRHV